MTSNIVTSSLSLSTLSDHLPTKKRKYDKIHREVEENGIIITQSAEVDALIANFPRTTHNSSANGNICQFCNLSLSDFKATNIHKRQKHPEAYFSCPNVMHCENPGGEQTMFEGVREMVSHYMQKHLKQENGNIACAVPNCGQSYANRNGLNKHLIKHHDEEQLRLLAANFYLKENSSHIHHRVPRWKK